MFCSNCGSQINDGSKFCFNCGSKTDENSSAINRSDAYVQYNQDKLNSVQITEYLDKARILENDCYTLEQTKKRIENKIKALGIRQNIRKPKKSDYHSPVEDFLGEFLGDAFMYFFFVPVIALVLALLSNFINVMNLAFGVRYIISLIICIAAYLMFFIIDYIKNERKYRSACEEYETAVRRDVQRVNSEIRQQGTLQIHVQSIDNQIAQIRSTLEKCYSIQVLHPKYCNMIATNTIYEYFTTGRVVSLTGTNGAYNLFEAESRQNIIISKLDMVIERLEQIKANQYMIYEAINEATYVADSILTQSVSIAERCGRIEENSALTAYNSKIAADNSNFLSLLGTASYIEHR